jgi:hypothetical protein
VESRLKVFTLEIEEGFEFVRDVDSDKYALLDELFDGTPRVATWNPVSVEIVSQEKPRRSLRRSDAPWIGSNILILRPEAAAALTPFLARYGELLPLSCEQSGLTAFNALCVVDALDEDASVLKRFSTGRIMWIKRHVFRKELVHGLQVFKITSLQPSPLFVGEEFVKLWQASGLKGLEFPQVWEG